MEVLEKVGEEVILMFVLYMCNVFDDALVVLSNDLDR